MRHDSRTTAVPQRPCGTAQHNTTTKHSTQQTQSNHFGAAQNHWYGRNSRAILGGSVPCRLFYSVEPRLRFETSAAFRRSMLRTRRVNELDARGHNTSAHCASPKHTDRAAARLSGGPRGRVLNFIDNRPFTPCIDNAPSLNVHSLRAFYGPSRMRNSFAANSYTEFRTVRLWSGAISLILQYKLCLWSFYLFIHSHLRMLRFEHFIVCNINE